MERTPHNYTISWEELSACITHQTFVLPRQCFRQIRNKHRKNSSQLHNLMRRIVCLYYTSNVCTSTTMLQANQKQAWKELLTTTQSHEKNCLPVLHIKRLYFHDNASGKSETSIERTPHNYTISWEELSVCTTHQTFVLPRQCFRQIRNKHRKNSSQLHNLMRRIVCLYYTSNVCTSTTILQANQKQA